MKYRYLGNTGIQISEIGLGSWMTFGEKLDQKQSFAILEQAIESGVNFIDTADIYAVGKAEEIIGNFLKEEVVRRRDLVISSKVYWGMSDNVNDKGLSRKHIMESIDDSLERLQTDYLDIYFAHYYPEHTALADSVTAFHDLITQGKTHYWGTSVFTGAMLERTLGICRDLKVHPPKVEQPRYNMLERFIELDVMEICANNNMGIVVWSPLQYGLLTGKYNSGVPEGSRFDRDQQKNDEFLERHKTNLEKITKLGNIAKEMEITTAQLALAWIMRRKEITSTITGASKADHLQQNALASAIELSAEICERIEKIMENKPEFPYPYVP